jgi:hypothetical protein
MPAGLTRGPNVSHIYYYDDDDYSFITDLFDDAVNRSDYAEFSNMIVELEYVCLQFHSSICMLRLKELKQTSISELRAFQTERTARC